MNINIIFAFVGLRDGKQTGKSLGLNIYWFKIARNLWADSRMMRLQAFPAQGMEDDELAAFSKAIANPFHEEINLKEMRECIMANDVVEGPFKGGVDEVSCFKSDALFPFIFLPSDFNHLRRDI